MVTNGTSFRTVCKSIFGKAIIRKTAANDILGNYKESIHCNSHETLHSEKGNWYFNVVENSLACHDHSYGRDHVKENGRANLKVRNKSTIKRLGGLVVSSLIPASKSEGFLICVIKKNLMARGGCKQL